MGRETPELDGQSPAERAQALRREAMATLDLALSAHGSEQALLLDTALKLRHWAQELEEGEGD